ncbi:MAG: hypothetical protein K9M56_03725 [Victivallales bacterium]|nr:hypothetical protein [Victivallales bacterium]
MYKHKNRLVSKAGNLTLVELMVALIVSLILFSAMMKIFNSLYKNLGTAKTSSNIYQNARIALDVIGRDLQCAYYGNSSAPFWHHSSVSEWGEYNNELLAFVSNSPFPSNYYSSDLFEVKYQLFYPTSTTQDSAGWILRSVTGNISAPNLNNPKWNFNNNFNVGYTTNSVNPAAAFTADSSSSSNFHKLVPYVTSLSFKCYNENGTEIEADTSISTAEDNAEVTGFPYSLEMNISLLDKTSWDKWIKAGGTPDNLENDPAYYVRKKYERSFKQTVLIGNRGQ